MENGTELLEMLSEKVKQLKLSNSQIARIADKSTGTISQVLNGKYKGRPEVVEEILAAVAELEEKMADRKPTPSEVKWLSSGEKLIHGILNLTYHYSGFSAVVGPSGLGKTFTARYFANEHADVAYTRCSDGMSMGDTIQMLLDVTGSNGYGTKTQKMKRAINGLKDRGISMILVDEADLLTTDRTNKHAILKKISVFREVKESGIGVAMIGLVSFDDTLRVVGETYVTSRLDYFRKVSDPSYEELAYYLANQGWDPEAADAQQVISMAPNRGGFRFLEKLSQTGKYLGSLAEALTVTYAAGTQAKGV